MKVHLDQPPDHRPVFIALGFLCLDQLDQGQDVDEPDAAHPYAPTPPPQRVEGIATVQHRHDVDVNPLQVRIVDSKLASVAAQEDVPAEGGEKQGLGVELIEGAAKSGKVGLTGEDGEIDIAAELDGPVHDAGLTAHQQGADPMLPESRKDFGYRVRARANLPKPKTSPRASATPRSAEPASATTSPVFRDHPGVHKGDVCWPYPASQCGSGCRPRGGANP